MTPAERARLNRDLADVAHRLALVATRLDQIEVPGRADARSLRRIALDSRGHAAFLARLDCLSPPRRRRGQPARGGKG